MKYLCYSSLIILIFCNSALASNNELRVAIFLEPPFVDLVDGKLVGENMDIIHLLAKKSNLLPIYLRCPPVRCLTMVKNGQADMMMGVSKVPSREEDLIFIEPPYLFQQQPLRFFTRKNKKLSINSFDDLEELLIGTLRGAVYFPQFDNNQTIKKIELTSRIQLVNMLLKGRIDTFLEREESVLPLLPEKDYQDKISIADYQYNMPIKSYIVLSKHSHIKAHAEKIAQVLTKIIEDGTIKSIIKNNRDNLAKTNQIKKAH